MKKMNVLLLGWEFPPVINGEVATACYGISKALANRVNLSLILPKSDPEFILKNVDLTGLNNVNLKEMPAPAPNPENKAFAETTNIQRDIPLYGAPTQTQWQAEPVPTVQEQPGQAVSVGNFAGQPAAGTEPEIKKLTETVEELNIFGRDLDLADYNSQVIHYARYASRLAAQKQYDVIYAYDWMTFLAGIELKLVSSKPLVLHMHSLSYERGGPDAKGWVYELEKQALEKSDFIFANTKYIAEVIVAEYGIAEDKIRTLQEEDKATEAPAGEPAAETISDEIFNMEVSESNNDLVKDMLPMAAATKEEDWEKTADKIWESLLQLQGEEASA
jgi:hypothetical protein